MPGDGSRELKIAYALPDDLQPHAMHGSQWPAGSDGATKATVCSLLLQAINL